jgi:hypothetical protein
MMHFLVNFGAVAVAFGLDRRSVFRIWHDNFP